MVSPCSSLAGRRAGRLKVVKVDVDANPRLVARFGAQSIPLLVVIHDGREVDRMVGGLLVRRSSSGSRRCSPAEGPAVRSRVAPARLPTGPYARCCFATTRPRRYRSCVSLLEAMLLGESETDQPALIRSPLRSG